MIPCNTDYLPSKKNLEGSACQVIPEPMQDPSLDPTPAQFIQEAIVPDGIQCIAKIAKNNTSRLATEAVSDSSIQSCHLVNSR
jgi:hypothetical protein